MISTFFFTNIRLITPNSILFTFMLLNDTIAYLIRSFTTYFYIIWKCIYRISNTYLYSFYIIMDVKPIA